MNPVNDAPSFALLQTPGPAGATWTARESNRGWQSIASSADGTKLAAVVLGGQIYTSIDSGTNWTVQPVGLPASAEWNSIASSADGTKLAAVMNRGQIYTSVGQAGANQTVAADGVLRTVANFATGFSPGPANESAQTLLGYTVNVEASKSGLFTAIQVANNGTLTFTPAVGSGGSALIEVVAQDSGGTSPGVDKSTNTFTITLTPAPKNIAIAATDATKAEGNTGTTPFTFTVTRSGDTTAAASVGWAVTGGEPSGNTFGAADVADFGGTLPSGTVNFAAGETSKVITLNVTGDTGFEFEEGFTVTLSNPTGATITTATAIGVIQNDDIGLGISASDATKAEGNTGTTPFTFNVQRGIPASGSPASTVDWAVTGSGPNPATAADFGGTFPSGTVNFPVGTPGQTFASVVITLNVSGDTAIEGDEGFTVTLSNPSAGTLFTGQETAAGLIQNDDANHAPAGTDKTITTLLEDSAHTFAVADFGFTDPLDTPANALLAVKITTLPGAGSLTSNGVAVAVNQFVSAADLSGGKLKFTPATNANGAAYASFTFQVQDNGGIANAGVDLDPTPNTLTLNVTAVNDAPSFAFGASPAGATLTARESSRQWYGITSSADGTKLAAVAYGGQIYTSTDSGATWTARESSRDWWSITSSADGTKLAAVVAGGQIYTSVSESLANQTVAAGAGAQSVANFATGFSPGPANESAQTLVGYTVTVESGKSALFSVAPAIANNGTLTFTPATGGSGGSALITVVAQDSGGTDNGGTDKSTNTFTITVTAPANTVASVTGPAAGSYKAGATLSFTVNYSAAVTVTGTPRLPLTIGSASVNATYASGSGSTALVFSYTVQAGDTDADGIAAASPLVLNGGTIKNGALDAVLTFTPPTTTSVLVDTTPPTTTISAPVLSGGATPAPTPPNRDYKILGASDATKSLTFVTDGPFDPMTGPKRAPDFVLYEYPNVNQDSAPSALFPFLSAANSPGSATSVEDLLFPGFLHTGGGTTASGGPNPYQYFRNKLSSEVDFIVTPSSDLTGKETFKFNSLAGSRLNVTYINHLGISLTKDLRVKPIYYGLDAMGVPLCYGYITCMVNPPNELIDTPKTYVVLLYRLQGNDVATAALSGLAQDVASSLPVHVEIAKNTPATVTPAAPSAGPNSVAYTVTYADVATVTSTLAANNVTLNKTGDANGTIAVTGNGATRTVTISGLTGNGTLGISVAAGTASDVAGNQAPAAGPSGTFAVETVAPTISISAPSVSGTVSGSAPKPVTYTVTYADANFNGSTLSEGNITLIKTGTANGTVAVDIGTGSTRTVTILGITGSGTLGISIASGTGSDVAGNLAPAAGPSTTFAVVPPAPAIVIEESGTGLLTGATVGFGVQAVNSTTTKTFTIRNTGSAPLTVSEVNLFNPAAPRQNAALPGDVNDNGTVTTLDLTLLNQSSQGNPLAIATAKFPDVNGDNVVSRADANPVTEHVFGIRPLQFHFTVNNVAKRNTFPPNTSVAPGGSTTFTVEFVPKSDGPKQLVLRIISNDSDRGTVDLILAGGPPAPNVAPVVAFARESVEVPQNAAAISLPGFATFNPGAYEAGQALAGYTVTVQAGREGLFSAAPTIGNSGTLAFTPATGQSGTATITVGVQDNGGTANGGVDRGTSTFTIAVVPAQFVVTDANQLTTAIANAASGTTILIAGNVDLSAVGAVTKNVKLVAGTGAALTGTLQVGSGGMVDLGGANLPGASITVQSGGTLAGSGSFNGTLVVQSGGKVSPGASPGTIGAATGTWAGGGSYDWEINNANGAPGQPVSDLLVFSGTLSVTATPADKFIVRVKTLTAANQPGLLAGFDPGLSYTWTIAQAASVTGFDANALTLDTTGVVNGVAGGTFALQLTGGNVQMKFTPAPPVPPVMAIQPGSGNLTLIWAVPVAFFDLESTATPQVPGSWVPVLALPTVTNGTNYLTLPTVPPAAARQFYRLRTP